MKTLLPQNHLIPGTDVNMSLPFWVAACGSLLLCLQSSSAYYNFQGGNRGWGPFQFISSGKSPNGNQQSSYVSFTIGGASRAGSRYSASWGGSYNPSYNSTQGHGYHNSSPNSSPNNPLVIPIGPSRSPQPEGKTCKKIKTEDYFRNAQEIPMKLYNTFVCAVFKKSPILGEVRSRLQSPEKVWRKLNKDIEIIDCECSIQIYRFYGETKSGYALRFIKTMLYEGFDQWKEQILKRALLKRLNVSDLKRVFSYVFGSKTKFRKTVEKRLGVFYVVSPQSTMERLADVDRKRLFADLILVANGKLGCPRCEPNFYNEDELVTAVSERLLPQHMTNKNKEKALGAIKFISEAKLTSKKVSKLLGNLVHSKFEKVLVTSYML